MNHVIVDAELRARLNNLDDLLELRDEETGRALGFFQPTPDAGDTHGLALLSPISREELERRRAQRGGRPLSEILNRLMHS